MRTTDEYAVERAQDPLGPKTSRPPPIDWEVRLTLEHPPHSTVLVPSNLHLFGPLKEALRGRRLASGTEVWYTVQMLLPGT